MTTASTARVSVTDRVARVADIVAGAVRAEREGVATYREILGPLVQVFEVAC